MATQIKLPGYETTVITRSDLSDEGLKTLNDRIGGIITSFGGELVMHEDWGKKKMAYPIEKENRGQYTYLAYTGKPGIVHEIERNLRIHESVLRYLSVTVGKEVDPADFRKHREDMKEAAKKREEERAARREERNANRGDRDDRRSYGGYGDNDYGHDE